jgi:hypothetical protein
VQEGAAEADDNYALWKLRIRGLEGTGETGKPTTKLIQRQHNAERSCWLLGASGSCLS